MRFFSGRKLFSLNQEISVKVAQRSKATLASGCFEYIKWAMRMLYSIFNTQNQIPPTLMRYTNYNSNALKEQKTLEQLY